MWLCSLSWSGFAPRFHAGVLGGAFGLWVRLSLSASCFVFLWNTIATGMTLYTCWPVASWLPEPRDRPFSHHPHSLAEHRTWGYSIRFLPLVPGIPYPPGVLPPVHAAPRSFFPALPHSLCPGPRSLSGGDGHLDAARTWRVQLHALPRELVQSPHGLAAAPSQHLPSAFEVQSSALRSSCVECQGRGLNSGRLALGRSGSWSPVFVSPRSGAKPKL